MKLLPRPFRLLAAYLVMAVGCTPVSSTQNTNAKLFRVGVSEIDITPNEPIRLTGYESRVTPSQGIGERLWAKALAFGDDQHPAVLITTDLIGVPRHLTEELLRRLQKAGITREQLAVSATHTHTGPAIPGLLPYIFGASTPPEQQVVIERYSNQLVDKLEQVAFAALADRRPSRVTWGQGKVGFASNRRVLKHGKWIAFGVQRAGPVDRDLPIFTVRAENGSLRAVLISYACHATTLEAKFNLIHGDWPGAAQALIQQRHPGAIAMVVIGTGADADPNPRGGGIPNVERHAREIANEVDRLLATALRPVTASPIGRFRYLDVAFARVPSHQELEEQVRRNAADGFYARSLLQQLERGELIPQAVAYPIQTWIFGNDLAMVFLGGEVVADYGLRLKRELDRSRVWVNAYTNDVAFYVVSRRMIPEGGYEVDRSMVYYGQPAPLAEGTEDQIVRGVRELLPAAFLARP